MALFTVSHDGALPWFLRCDPGDGQAPRWSARLYDGVAASAPGGLATPELDLGPAAAGEVAVAELDVADHPLGAGQVDDAGAGVGAEDQPGGRRVRRAVLEPDHQVVQLDRVALDGDHDLAKRALVPTDMDHVVVVAAIDRALAEPHPVRVSVHRARLPVFPTSLAVCAPRAGDHRQQQESQLQHVATPFLVSWDRDEVFP